MRALPRRAVAVLACVVGSVALGLVPTVAGGSIEPPQACDPATKAVTLFAEKIGPKRYGYGLAPGKASIPGPTLEIQEGGCLQVTLVNDADRPLSMHAHGVVYSFASDGTPINNGCVRPGRSKTYVFRATPPGPRGDGTIDSGSAGYWHYHDHCLGGPHGTEGVSSGLFGALIVRRDGDLRPDRDPFVVVMTPGTTINLRDAPSTPVFKANLGERIEFVVIAHGDDFHTFHLHAHRWADNRTGYVTSPDDGTRTIDNRTIGPADSFGFQVVAGEGAGPAAWMFHCHVQGHSDGGMTGILLVRTAEGLVTPQAQNALERWRKLEKHHVTS